MDSAQDMLAGTPGEMDYRNATSLAYYAIHHALRAVLLFDVKADTYGHNEFIEAFAKRMSRTPALRAKADAAGITEADLLNVLHHRHLADYHCYGSPNRPNRPRTSPPSDLRTSTSRSMSSRSWEIRPGQNCRQVLT